MPIMVKGEIEVDRERGVLYFHNYVNGCTTLRICGLKKELKKFRTTTQLDIIITEDVRQAVVMKSDMRLDPVPNSMVRSLKAGKIRKIIAKKKS